MVEDDRWELVDGLTAQEQRALALAETMTEAERNLADQRRLLSVDDVWFLKRVVLALVFLELPPEERIRQVRAVSLHLRRPVRAPVDGELVACLVDRGYVAWSRALGPHHPAPFAWYRLRGGVVLEVASVTTLGHLALAVIRRHLTVVDGVELVIDG